MPDWDTPITRSRANAEVPISALRSGDSLVVVGVSDGRYARAALLLGLVEGTVLSVTGHGHRSVSVDTQSGERLRIPSLIARYLRCRRVEPSSE